MVAVAMVVVEDGLRTRIAWQVGRETRGRRAHPIFPRAKAQRVIFSTTGREWHAGAPAGCARAHARGRHVKIAQLTRDRKVASGSDLADLGARIDINAPHLPGSRFNIRPGYVW
jgi:hypothetical protein